MTTFALVGLGRRGCDRGSACDPLPVNDMQIAEDLQLVVGHICLQWLVAAAPRRA
jgi:D-sedoheptulose 7-phosphate isomerase